MQAPSYSRDLTNIPQDSLKFPRRGKTETFAVARNPAVVFVV